ncbi:histidine kinase [Enterobacterales bacterium CwR94]|nr:histidine kinase [Enterobacterales bacterium CwR94]
MWRLACALLCVLSLSAHSLAAAPEPLTLLARTSVQIADPGLTPEEWRWVRERQTLRVGVWSPDNPPYGMREGLHDYGGINADFIGLITQNLNLRVQLTHYTSLLEAVLALQRNEIDVIPGPSEGLSPEMIQGLSWSESLIGEVRRSLEAPGDAPLRIAFSSPWQAKNLSSRYPDAEIKTFSSPRLALEALAFGQLDRYIVDIITARYVINQSNLNTLDIHPLTDFPSLGMSLATLPRNEKWLTIINRVIYALPPASRTEIVRRWNGGIPISVSEEALVMTSLEQRWITEHPQIRVAIVGDSAPLAYYDVNNQLRGINADILTALALRTGLHFTVQRFDTLSAALASVSQGNSDMIAGASLDAIWHHNLLTTRPWLSNSWVMVGNRQRHPDTPPRIRYLADEAPLKWLRQTFPNSDLVAVSSWREGVELVAQHKNDQLVMPLIIATDMLDHLDDNNLAIQGSLDTPPIRFVMGTSRNNYPLVTLMDKAILNIPPEDLHALTRNAYNSRFQAVLTENKLKPTQFYLLLVGSLLLAALSGGVIWGLHRRYRRQQSLVSALQEAQQAALDASRVKGAFLATMSHEIRTPISAIIGMLELTLQRPAHAPENQQSLRIAHQAAQSLLQLIGDILDISRIESNRLVLRPERVAIRDLISSVAILFDGLALQKGLRLSLELDTHIRGDVLADPVRIKQILANLLGNAVKFSDSGTLYLRAYAGQQDENALQLLLEVADEGPGIDAETRARLFHPFEQGDSQQQAQGSGLGLYICRTLAEMMDGSITLDSEPGQGTRVRVDLKLPRMAESTVAPVPAPAALHTQRLQIVIVDDNPATRLLLQQQLEHLHQRVTSCASAADALASMDDSVDLVITDCNMPTMDGLALTRELHQQYPTLPVWGMTADAQLSKRDACLAAGMQHCFFKPVTLQTLQEALHPMVPTAFEPARTADRDLLATLPAALLSEANRRQFLQLQIDVIDDALPQLQHGERDDIASALHRLRGGIQLLNVPDLSALCLAQETSPTPEGLAEVILQAQNLKRNLLILNK